jgi:hypothetical protein
MNGDRECNNTMKMQRDIEVDVIFYAGSGRSGKGAQSACRSETTDDTKES